MLGIADITFLTLLSAYAHDLWRLWLPVMDRWATYLFGYVMFSGLMSVSTSSTYLRDSHLAIGRSCSR